MMVLLHCKLGTMRLFIEMQEHELKDVRSEVEQCFKTLNETEMRTHKVTLQKDKHLLNTTNYYTKEISRLKEQIRFLLNSCDLTDGKY